ncbi:MAG: efflux RND transporter periplasmic adaptor subunit, partial [Dokdonella sp.]|nr:efflux RND transporter periplasmic adaptor subunit [Dokdonella sp.]
PATGVQQGPDGQYAWVVQGDDTVAMRPLVSAGAVDGGGVLIESGLALGERVVTEGQFRLKTGSKVLPLAPGEVAAPKPPATEGAPRPGR